MLDVLASSTEDKLVSLSDCMEAMDLTDANDGVKLERFIKRATARIESYCNRPLRFQRYRAALPSYGGWRLQLPAYPVRGVLRVFDGTDTGTARELTSTEYKVDAARGWLTMNDGTNFPWTVDSFPEVSPLPEPLSEKDNWLVEFTAGYTLAGTTSTADGVASTGPTTPLDLQDAAIALVRSKWYSRTRDQAITSKKVGELSITYDNSAAADYGLPKEVCDLLAPYRSLT